MSGIPFDMIGFVTSILGIFGLIPLIWMIILYQLPQYKLKQLDATIEETTVLLETAVQNGFVPGPTFVLVMETRLRSLRYFTEDLRAQVARAAGFRNQCLAAVGGLSRRISKVCGRVGLIRTRIAITSDQERRKVESGNRRNDTLATPFSAIQSEQIEPTRGDDELLKYDDLETLELFGSLTPSLEPPNVTIPPPMYSVHTPSIQYQPFRESSSSALDLDALSMHQGPSKHCDPKPPTHCVETVTALSSYGRRSSMASVNSPAMQGSHLPSQVTQERPITRAVAGTSSSEVDGHLPQSYRDDIQGILAEFRHQLLGEITSSVQDIVNSALESVVQGPS